MRIHSVPALLILGLALAAAPTAAQITNPGFENNVSVPLGWTTIGGISIVFPGTGDAGFPTEGLRYLQTRTSSTGPATPHSNPGGFGSDATAVSGSQTTFLFPNTTDTRIEFDCLFLSTEPSTTMNNDFLEASVSDGVNVYNLIHLDLSDLGGGPATSVAGATTTPIQTVSADLGALFPTATGSTVFTLRLMAGNVGSTAGESRAYWDDIRFVAGTPVQAHTITITDMGASQLLQIHTINGNTRFYTLISTDVSGPVAAGPALGLYLSPLLIQILTLPLGTYALHDLTPASGNYPVPIPTFANPPGTTFDYLLAVINPAGLLEAHTIAKRYVWP